MEIYCYEYSESGLVLKGVIDDFISYNFTRSYSGIGQWQLVIDGTSLNASRIKGIDIIRSGNGVAGLVQSVSENKNAAYTITYTGIELKGLASQRIIEPPAGQSHLKFTNTAPEDVIAGILTTQIINPESASRKIKQIAIAPYEASSDATITYEGRFQNVADEIGTIASTYHIGWYADIQDGVITYYIYHGVDRTEGQDINSRLILSIENDNIENSLYEQSERMPNVILVAGQGEGVNREIVRSGNATGFLRSEIYQDARDIEQGQTALLQQRAKETLASYGDNSNYAYTFSASFARFYREDYELGDQGTIKDSVLPNGCMDFRLNAITEVYESDSLSLNAVFGDAKNSLTDAISRISSGMQSLLRTENAGTSIEALWEMFIDREYPVGRVIETYDANFNPNIAYTGTWERCQKGRVSVGVDENDSDFETAGKTGGTKTVSLTEAQGPRHCHTHTDVHGADEKVMVPNGAYYGVMYYNSETQRTTGYSGNGAPHENMPPYETVYKWRRTA